MSDASLPKHEIFRSEIISSQPQSSQHQTNQRQTTRKGFWAALLEALHHSRRLEAQRILRRYQHLIDSAAQHQTGKSNIEKELTMPLSERRSERKEQGSERRLSIVQLSEYALLVAIAIGFLALHILTGATFWPASKDPAATTEPAKSLSGD